MTIESQVQNDGVVREILSVSQLNASVSQCLADAFGTVWVRGEVSNFTAAASGHWYFTLKDAGAAVKAVMFRSRAQAVGFLPRAGDRIEIRARVSLYEPRGDYQLQVDALRRAGLGDLYEAFLRLKQQLQDEGLFDPARKRPLPAMPRAIGVVTSRQAAALRDVLSALARRAPQVPIIVYPAPVQGAQAAAQLARAVQQANARQEVDVLLVVRGGGSIEDLWSFNEAVLAYAIAASEIPVISGVGHETDFTIADFVADVRAPTPTAAAELACPPVAELREQVRRLAGALHDAQTYLIERLAQRVDYAGARLVSPAQRLARQQEHLLASGRRMALAMPVILHRQRQRFSIGQAALARNRPDVKRRGEQLRSGMRNLASAARHLLARRQQRWEVLAARLAAQDPAQPLKRGFALVTDASGAIVRDAAQLRPQQRLEVRFGQGEASVDVIEARGALPVR